MQPQEPAQDTKRWRVRARLITWVELDAIPGASAAEAQAMADTALSYRYPGIGHGTTAIEWDSVEPSAGHEPAYRHSGRPFKP